MNNWSKRIEQVVIKIATKAAAYKYIHDESSYLYYRINLIFSILIILLITATGTITLSIVNEDNDIIQYTNGVILFITSVLSSIKEFINFTRLSEQHKLYSIRFSNLYHHIQRQLLTDIENRQDARDYLGWINNEYDSLLLTNPEVPSHIKNKMHNKFGDVLDINLFELTLYDNFETSNVEHSIEILDNETNNISRKNRMTQQQMYELQRFAN